MKLIPLGEIANFINGRAFKPEEWEATGRPIIRIQNLTSSSGVVNCFSGEIEPKYLVRQGDILISWSASLGVYRWQGPEAILNQHIFRVEVNHNLVDENYFFYAVQSVLDEMVAQIHGATMQHITREPFEATRVPLPPLPEQRRLAAILDKADRLRRLRRYALDLSDSYLQSVFLGMFGEYLKGQSETRLENVLEQPLQNGLFETNDKYSSSGTPVIWVDNLYHTISVATKGLRRVSADKQVIEKYKVTQGDLLFTRSSLVREGVGQVNIVPLLTEEVAFECHIIRARVDRKLINPYYVLQLYRSAFGRSAIMQRAKTATMTTIGQEDIKTLPCPIPPFDLQDRFACIIYTVERLDVQQREAARQAEHLFQTLLHQAFAGELAQQHVVTVQAKLPQGIYFTRGAIAAYIINHSYQQNTFGRVKFEKLQYMTEAHVGIDLAGHYQRAQLGPLDINYLSKLESLAQKKGWFKKYKRADNRERYYYRPGPNMSGRVNAAKAILGSRRAEMDRLLNLFADLNTEEAEVVATLFAAWNDFLLDGTAPTDEQIIREVRENWHEKKKRFSPEELRKMLEWLRQYELTPTGIGPHTQRSNWK